MPENTNPADGGAGTAGDPASGAGAPDAGAEAPKLTMTQAELDRIIEQRVARAKPKDYDDLVKLRDKVAAAEEAEKTELTKAQEAEKKAKADAQTAIDRANGILVRAAIMVEATAQNAADADTVAALLTGTEAITVDDDGNVKGAKQAVKKLLEDKPFLVKAAAGKPGASGGEFGGNDSRTVQERIAEAESKGDFKESRRLKLAQSLTAR